MWFAFNVAYVLQALCCMRHMQLVQLCNVIYCRRRRSCLSFTRSFVRPLCANSFVFTLTHISWFIDLRRPVTWCWRLRRHVTTDNNLTLWNINVRVATPQNCIRTTRNALQCYTVVYTQCEKWPFEPLSTLCIIISTTLRYTLQSVVLSGTC